ncbi:putative 2-(5''-triphosphoribosyl)-3'-dephosphocoenzyme-A synthase [Xylocopilactobacillus apicola]|uniref:Probable 2-(5''-triphosphoribosyl)-3'-dephosphocoenzyme-A synthase n=2 Tax=Xylocopilactobacillus apicola TaxID=2932184 RepID=A0AAU9DSP6_9LACO|nr:putative 2-(5''-triphosphoribosyl)-3'-dephosphocoenzyme-A synthase [Xylocopilactobacillus apicola]
MKIELLPELAEQALIDEVMVYPKPGLVDPLNHGSHPDMDVFTFVASAVSLRAYFEEITELANNFTAANLPKLFQQVRLAGIKAEQTMFKATNGINTHKGAIFSLGILLTASAYTLSSTGCIELDEIAQTVKVMLKGLTKNDFRNLDQKPLDELTAGELEYKKYGLTGSRGEAEAGFPVVFKKSLPFLLTKSNQSRNSQLIDTLMQIVLTTKDSNLIKRAGNLEIVDWAEAQASRYFELGGSQTEEGYLFLRNLDDVFTQQHLSLGGSADLLILTIFLDLLVTKNS